MNNLGLGKRGEALAERLLRQNGYRVLEKNVKARFGEIDLVAEDQGTLCFVEIKTRSSTRLGFPEESVNAYKQRRLVRLAQWYCAFRRKQDVAIRFDVVSILMEPDGLILRTRLIKNAFEAML